VQTLHWEGQVRGLPPRSAPPTPTFVTFPPTSRHYYENRGASTSVSPRAGWTLPPPPFAVRSAMKKTLCRLSMDGSLSPLRQTRAEPVRRSRARQHDMWTAKHLANRSTGRYVQILRCLRRAGRPRTAVDAAGTAGYRRRREVRRTFGVVGKVVIPSPHAVKRFLPPISPVSPTYLDKRPAVRVVTIRAAGVTTTHSAGPGGRRPLQIPAGTCEGIPPSSATPRSARARRAR